jgi:integrase
MRTYGCEDELGDTEVILGARAGALRKRDQFMKITDYEIHRFRLPANKDEQVVFDDDQPGFGIHFRRSGSNSFVVQYGSGKNRKRPAIGRVGEIKAAEARRTAQEWMAAFRAGRDPQAEKAKAKLQSNETFGLLLPKFLEHQLTEWKARTHQEATYCLNAHTKPFRPLPVSAIDQRMVVTRLDEVRETSGPGARNSTRAYLSAFFNWAIDASFCTENPAERTVKVTIAPRQRQLTDPETKVILLALNEPGRVDEDYRDILRLALYEGLRRDEVGKLRWDEVKLGNAAISFPAGRTKNGKPWIVPLSAPALEILRARHAKLDPDKPREYVFGRRNSGFSGWSKAKKEFDTRVTALNGGQPLEPWVMHDFRRLISTSLTERLSVAPHLADVCLGHAQGGIQAVYNLAQYVSERRLILEKWARHLESIATGQPPDTKVVNFGKRR